MVSEWLTEAYEGGYWDVNTSDGQNVQDLIDDGTIGSPGDISPANWEDDGVGGQWFNDVDGAGEMYEKLWNDARYQARWSRCYHPSTFTLRFANTSFEEEFGEFDEYCTDSCGCAEEGDDDVESEGEDANVEKDDDDDIMLILVVVLGVLLAISLIVILLLMLKNKKLSKSTKVKAHHVAQVSPCDTAVVQP